jgi:hypothetical protein
MAEKFLTRKQIAAFVGNDPEAIRAIERLFAVTGELTPGDIATLNAAIEANTLAIPPPPVPPKRRVYGQFYDTTVQTAAVINTAYSVTMNTTDLSFGVYLVSSSRITVTQAGLYNFQHSMQVDSSAGVLAYFYLWLSKNNVDIPNTARRLGIVDSLVANVATGSYVLDLKANDYIEYKWSTDDTAVQIARELAAPPVPVTPAVIVTVTDGVGG